MSLVDRIYDPVKVQPVLDYLLDGNGVENADEWLSNPTNMLYRDWETDRKSVV